VLDQTSYAARVQLGVRGGNCSLVVVAVAALVSSNVPSAIAHTSPPNPNCPGVTARTYNGVETFYPQTSADVTCKQADTVLRRYYADALAGKCRGSGCFAAVGGGWTCDSPTWDEESGIAVGCYRHKLWIDYGYIPYGAHHP
jgi:hypothetical protein